ncbi:hypothetical protein ACIOVF_00355 [Pseudomonas sp. NPDC087612]|uniref:hypothetical protein n=1 Tax=Pseudomonas sp. NPDC087612 TaxID=3364441 RepID=UPI003805A953
MRCSSWAKGGVMFNCFSSGDQKTYSWFFLRQVVIGKKEVSFGVRLHVALGVKRLGKHLLEGVVEINLKKLMKIIASALLKA